MTVEVRQHFATILDAQLFVESYLQQWHPLGYGTMARIVPADDGGYDVHITRGESCE